MGLCMSKEHATESIYVELFYVLVGFLQDTILASYDWEVKQANSLFRI